MFTKMSSNSQSQQCQIIMPNPNNPYHNMEDSSYLSSISNSTIFLHDGVLRSLNLSSLKEFEQQYGSKFHDALTISSVDQMEELMAVGLSTASTPSSGNHQNTGSATTKGSANSTATDLLSRKILKLATLHVQSIGLHHRYQWHVLERAWRYKLTRAQEKSDETLTDLKSSDALQSGNDPSSNNRLGFKLSLCLLVPMLELYSQDNNSVALSALQLLFSELSSVPIGSLNQESSNSLEKLEDLLGRWAANPSDSFQCSGPSAMIALCCARGSISSFAKTILMLENLDCPMRPLPVAPILRKLNDSRQQIGKPCGIMGDKLLISWPYDDRLLSDAIQSGKPLGLKTHPSLEQLLAQIEEEKGTQDDNQSATQQTRPTVPPRLNVTSPNANSPITITTGNGNSSPVEEINKHFVAPDGTFLYVTGPNGKGLTKMGTGLKGSVQGWVYNNNLSLKCGFLAFADGLLISRIVDLDLLENSQKTFQNKLILGVVINQDTLTPEKLLLVEEDTTDQNRLTLAMVSDGSLLYFVRAEIPSSSQTTPTRDPTSISSQSGNDSNSPPPIQVWMDIYGISHSSGLNAIAIPKFLRIPLNRSPEENATGNGNPILPPIPEGANRISLAINEERGANAATIRRTRSVRITPATPLSSAPVPNSPADQNTSVNLTLRQLQHSLFFTCGNYLTVVVSNNLSFGLVGGGPLSSPPPPPPANTLGPFPGAVTTGRQYAPVISSNCSKSAGVQLHFSLQQLSSSPVSTKQDLGNLSADSSFFHGAIIPEMGATYDQINNVIWTVNGTLLDCWKNPGNIPPWKQNQMLLLGNTTNDLISVDGPTGQDADVKTVTNVMLRHMAIMANHFLLGGDVREDANIRFFDNGDGTSNTAEVLKTLLELLCKYRDSFEGSELTALFLVLQATVSQVRRKGQRYVEQEVKLKKELNNVQAFVFCLLNDDGAIERFSVHPEVYQEACTLLAMIFDLLYVTGKQRSEFFEELYQYLGKCEDQYDDEDGGIEVDKSKSKLLKLPANQCLQLLEDSILQHFTQSLNGTGTHFSEGLKWVVETPWFIHVIQQAIKETKIAITKVANPKFTEVDGVRVTANFPVTSVCVGYINSVVNFLLRSLVHSITTTSSPTPSSSSTSLVQRNFADLSVEVFREVLKAGPTIVEGILEVVSVTEAPISYEVYSCTEAILKSSLLAHGIPQILGFLSLESVNRPILDELVEECIQLTVAMSFLAKKMNPGTGNSPPSHLDVGEDWSSKVRIPSPWTTKRVFESPHPVRENYKTKETIVIPGARQLYMKLSPQCATQYDYDRLGFTTTTGFPGSSLVSSNPATSAVGGSAPIKVLEFGGNYYGYGNRFFSGPGWNRQVVKLCDGSSIQYNFEMKSGREHSVPDKAVWGYQFTIFPIMDTSDPLKPQREITSPTEKQQEEDISTPSSLYPVAPGFATMTTLHCIDVIQNTARVLLNGSSSTPAENANGVLLENKLVASLKWPTTLKESPIPRKISTELITKVKRAVGVSPLQMRTSIIEKMRASELEELYIQCCMAHIGPNPFVNTETILSPACESCWTLDPTRDIFREIFRNIDTMFRRLMAFYEMEKMLSQEIEEISNNTKDIADVFFTDPSFMENPTDLQTLAWICYLDYDKDSPKSLINDVIAMCTALSADPQAPAQLTRTDELIEETHLKCKYLMAAVPLPSTMGGFYGPAYPSQKMVIERLHSIHSFISAHMYNPSATMSSFISAMRTRRERAGDRIKGLDILHKILECSCPSSALLIVVSVLLQPGPRLQSILCSGLEKEVLRSFGEVMKITVRIAEKNPMLHRYTIALLSITAYGRTDEENLVESGLVGVLDQLCAYQTGHLTPLNRNSPTETGKTAESTVAPEVVTAHNKASTLAWAAFQVLASQCASWEQPESHHGHQKTTDLPNLEDPSSEWDEPEHRELPLQISINITNHLARAAALAALSSDNQSYPSSSSPSSSCSQSLAIAIQDVLDLLNNLRTYKIGRAILKQSPCICRLLGLLQDSRLSPRLVLTILKLLHTALPLVDDLDTANFKQIVPFGRTGAIPANTSSNGSKLAGGVPAMASFWSIIESTPYTQVASMLLCKLADYLVCGSTTTSTSSKSSENKSAANHTGQTASSLSSQQNTTSIQQGLTDPSKHERMEVWVHKLSTVGGDHQSANSSSLIRQLFVDATRQDLKPTRGSLSELENEFNANGKVLLYTDESSLAERKALRISQLGHLVTLLPVGWSRLPYNMTIYNSAMSGGSSNQGSSRGGGGGGGSDLLCKDRNNHLSSWDPPRPFLSGHVAENLASEIVQLVRALLHTSAGRPSSSGTSTCGSRTNLNVHQSGSSSTSLASGVGAPGSGSNAISTVCTKTVGDADSLASEASAHLQMSKSSNQSQKTSAWPGAVEQIICAAMKQLPKLCQMPNPTAAHLESYVYSARLIIGALTVLGGFSETIRSGLEVWIVEEPNSNSGDREYMEGNKFDDRWEFKATKGRVVSVSDTTPTAKVELLPVQFSKKEKGATGLTVSDILTVPVSRLVPAHFTKCGQPNLPRLTKMAQTDLAGFLKTLLVLPVTNEVPNVPGSSKGTATQETSSKDFPLRKELPTLNQILNSANATNVTSSGGGTTSSPSSGASAMASSSDSRQIAQAMTIVRLLAEIRTKSMQVLALWLKRPEFRDIFMGISSDSQLSSKTFSTEVLQCTENLKELSKLCSPSHKSNSLEYQVAWMRLLYRDCTKPPRFPVNEIDKSAGEDASMMRWELSRSFPKIKSTVFSSVTNSLVYTGDYNVSGGNPRGLVLFGNGVIPTNGFYWEATIVSMEDMGVNADLIVVPPLSIGFSPVPLTMTSNNDIWKYPSGTVMYTTLGRVIHYKTQDPGSWVTLRLEDDAFRVKAGDTVGIGWEKLSQAGTHQIVPGNVTGAIQAGQQAAQRFNSQRRRVQAGGGRGSLATSLQSQTGIGRGARSTNQLSLDPGTNSGFGVRGLVYFTLNGRRLPSSVEQSNCSLHPIIHVQKRQMIVSTNLGERPYVYQEANKVDKSGKPGKNVLASGVHSATTVGVQDNQEPRSTDTATSNADVLLRRVSDSLQDVSLVFNMNINEFDSEPNINVDRPRSGSSSTVSNNSTRTRRGDLEVEIEEENRAEARDAWELDDEDDEDDGVVVEPEDEDDEDRDGDDDNDDDDSDPTEAVISEPNIARATTAGGGVLPPSPVSGASASGSSITIRRANVPGPLPPPPPPLPPASTRHRHQPRPSTARSSGVPKRKGSKPPDSFASISFGGGMKKNKNEVNAKAPQKHTEYNPIKSLEYFLGHSPTCSIKVFNGPRRYVCPCAVHTPTALDHLLLQSSYSQELSSSSTDDKSGRSDQDSLDSYEDDDGEDDIHSQLVKAWEQQVFPVIRRRFRNESERRDGLEQIRGALQLGMWDIARQTVEFLYEEGGGLPRDLHFPTLEEVRIEQARCTMDKLKPGMNVVIRAFSQQSSGSNQAVSEMVSALPAYAVPTMLRTFGLTGEVLEVDQAYDLVLVETYIESEGVLVRFWYPVSCLDKSPANKKPMLSTTTVNMFKLHSNLISMEESLCHLYARQCYLSLSHHCNQNREVVSPSTSQPQNELNTLKNPIFEKISNDFDLDSIQILSDDSLSNYPASRDLFTYNIQCESPSLKFLMDPGNPSVSFYHRGEHSLLSQHLQNKIRESLGTSPETLDKLTDNFLSCLASSEKFPYHDLRLDRIFDLEIVCPNSAFTLLSFKGPQNMTAKQLNSIDNTIHPCLHVFSYDSSEITRYPVACYPLEPLHVVMHRATSSTGEDGSPASIISHGATTTAGAANSSAAAAINKTMRKRHARFPPVMCPSNRIYCSISEISLPDVTAEVQGIPKEFPLALLYLQELIKAHDQLSFENVTCALTHLLDFLDTLHLTPVIKDWIFPLVADLTRIRNKQENVSWKPAPQEKVARSSTPNRFFLELLLLRERESADQSLPTHTVPLITSLAEHLEARKNKNGGGKSPSPQPAKGKQMTPATLMFHISNFISSHQKSNKSMTDPNFSYYFNSLNDLCLALNEVSEIMVNPYEIIPCSTQPSEISPSGTPSRKASTTESGSVSGSGVSSSPSSQVVPFSAVTKRPFAKAARKRQVIPSKDGFKVLKDIKKSTGGNSSGAGASGSGLSAALASKAGVLPSTSSEDGFLVFAKASEIEWFNNQVIITRVLRDIVWHAPNDGQCVEASQVLIGTVLEKLKYPSIHNRLLVIQDAPVNIDGMSIEASLIRALRGCGGIHGNEMWISGNSAVVEIRSLAKVNEAYDTLKQNKVWYPLEDYVLYPNVSVYKVSEYLNVMGSSAQSSTSENNQEGDRVLWKFLKSKLADPEISGKLSFKAREMLTAIFMSCYGTTIPFVIETSGETSDAEGEGEEERGSTVSVNKMIILSEEQMTLKNPGNLLDLFFGALKGSPRLQDPEKDALSRFGEKMKAAPVILHDHCSDIRNEVGDKDVDKDIKDGADCGSTSSEGPVVLQQQDQQRVQEDTVGLSLHGFLDWCTDLMKTQPNYLWKALFAAGYDLRLERVWLCQDPPIIHSYFHNPEKWNLEKDAALISYVDQFSQSLHIDPTRIQPSELCLTESDYLNPSFTTLQGVPSGYLRVRWGMFQKMNTLISKKLLAHGSLHNVKSSRRSLANLLNASRHLLLYYTKDTYLYKIIHVSAFRGSDTPTPEITLDPVSAIGTQDETEFKNQLSQVIQQMSTITTAFYCVPPAQGADPALPVSVKFQGEEVLGLSGSFRHFLLSAAKELQNETVKLFCRCPSADAGRNKDSFIITPGKLSYGEEDFLYFLGQLIGISIRSDAPLALSLLKSTWQSMLLSEKESNDISDDLVEADILCATYLRKLESLSTKGAFENFLSLNAWPKFQYPSMDNTSVVPLCPDGARLSVSFTNRDQFIKMIRQLREKELRCSNRVTKILTGLASIVPLPAILGLFTADHLELRIAGSPDVNLSLLKSHTHYQVGVSENDPHITYFWAALESFSPEELKKFIKFAANLERLPVTCPCQSSDNSHIQDSSSPSNNNIVHVPPFPMKIAPIDITPSASTEEIDRRLIRVETCLFLIRLPPYSSLQVTRQQLLFAINCREDPLSGLYETVKNKTANVEKNCVILQKREEILTQMLRKRETRYQSMKELYGETLEKVHHDLENKIREREKELANLKAKIRLCEVKTNKLEGEIEQVDRENEKLRSLREDLLRN